MTSGVPRVVRALFDRLFDYAGLFPPAALDLPNVARRYAEYRRGRFAWMLGRLVLPAAGLDAAIGAAAPWLPGGEGIVPWRVTAVLGADTAAELARVESANQQLRAGDPCPAIVDTVEARVTSHAQVDRLAAAAPAGVTVVYEVPDPATSGGLIDRIAERGGMVKIRAGGLTPDVFPSSRDLAIFLVESARAAVSVKFTAGLHHALRGEYALTDDEDSVSVTMHGFLNVLIATVVSRIGRASVERLAEILERRDGSRLEVTADQIRWGDVSLTSEEATRARAFSGGTIGSCSFEEPVGELHVLGLLP